jgi:arabinogalactan endo-1,4-beta-galactosidase
LFFKKYKDNKRFVFKHYLDRSHFDLYYSDTWSDSGNQKIPYAWKDLSFNVLKTAMREYIINTINYFKNNGVTSDYSMK